MLIQNFGVTTKNIVVFLKKAIDRGLKSCNKKIGSHCQPTIAQSSEHRLDANNLFTDGEKEALTREDEGRRTGEKKQRLW